MSVWTFVGLIRCSLNIAWIRQNCCWGKGLRFWNNFLASTKVNVFIFKNNLIQENPEIDSYRQGSVTFLLPSAREGGMFFYFFPCLSLILNHSFQIDNIFFFFFSFSQGLFCSCFIIFNNFPFCFVYHVVTRDCLKLLRIVIKTKPKTLQIK